MKTPEHNDPYTDPASGVLKNKLGLTDAAKLSQREAEYAALRSYELSQKPLQGHFDLKHLQGIHKHLFGDVYPWAGQLRSVDIAKERSVFASHRFIESAAGKIFADLAKENHLAGLSGEQFGARAAHYLGELNALHPFREGNGRAQREFISHLAYHNGHTINWSGMKREDMMQASIDSMHRGDSMLFAKMITANLRPRLPAEAADAQKQDKPGKVRKAARSQPYKILQQEQPFGEPPVITQSGAAAVKDADKAGAATPGQAQNDPYFAIRKGKKGGQNTPT